MTTLNFIQDKQTRTTQYGIKCFEVVDGCRFQRFAHAKKSGKFLTVGNGYADLVDVNNVSVNGKFRILETGKGILANVKCEKYNSNPHKIIS